MSPADADATAPAITVTAPSLTAGPRTPGLQQATWRGVPFAVLVGSSTFGRRFAVHEYPYRDKPWAEDLGRAARKFSLQGFLISDSLVYGGGDALDQREQMIAAAEGEGYGILVHPTLGSLKVALVGGLTIAERWQDGVRYFELNFQFVESGDATFPSNSSATQPATTAAAAAADSGCAADFANAVTPLLPLGGLTVQQAVAAAGSWGAQLVSLGADATSLVNMASQLVGNYGRFFNGGNAGFLGGLAAQILPASTTIDDLAADAAGDRATLAAATSAEAAIAGQLGLPNAQPTDMAGSAQAATAALLATAANPADALRMLANLATWSDGGLTAIGAAIDSLHRRAAVVALARASAAYNPTSYNDAAAIRALVCAALDQEIWAAGDAGEDNSFNALTALRVAVVQDLTTRGASLAAMVAVNVGASLPAVVLAQRLYRDTTRADQLVAEADPIHPLFMPTSFLALSR